jgi:hypothetical protein
LALGCLITRDTRIAKARAKDDALRANCIRPGRSLPRAKAKKNLSFTLDRRDKAIMINYIEKHKRKGKHPNNAL